MELNILLFCALDLVNNITPHMLNKSRAKCPLTPSTLIDSDFQLQLHPLYKVKIPLDTSVRKIL